MPMGNHDVWTGAHVPPDLSVSTISEVMKMEGRDGVVAGAARWLSTKEDEQIARSRASVIYKKFMHHLGGSQDE